ncbi:unnamed protein product [Angiostrongylus costaricensis]|uniref:Uncharacterized protein n=1 Tax=Angiostrongylus costaricensis TaxID=334426 RepID=A0A3P7JC92_ANGCS|nr:unnamed protein product [Angiostrongylus costaricensis]
MLKQFSKGDDNVVLLILLVIKIVVVGLGQYAKQRPVALRICFLSPTQCLLPVDDRRFKNLWKRFIYSSSCGGTCHL